MSYYEIIFLAYALSVDVCVVSFSYGLCLDSKHKRSSLLLASVTALFHIFMPILGYLFTDIVRVFIEPYAKFIVFAIFIYLGVDFIKGALKKGEPKKLCLDFKSIMLLAIATSIDVFSAGISLSLTSSPLKFSVIVLGIMTFLNSLFGYYMGYNLKVFKSKWLEIFGGSILIFLAFKNLFG